MTAPVYSADAAYSSPLTLLLIIITLGIIGFVVYYVLKVRKIDT